MIGTKILEERKSKYNGNLRVVKTWGMGTYIQSNGLTQSGGIVETIWKKTLRKIHDSRFQIQSVLILGLGGGTVSKLVKKNWPEATITGVDIDPVMIELGKKYLELGELKVETHIADALSFSQQLSVNSQRFDLVIVDLYNGDKFPKKFESKNYIHLVRRLLARSGIAVFNRLYYGEKRLEAEKFWKKLEKFFSKVERFRPEANLMFIAHAEQNKF